MKKEETEKRLFFRYQKIDDHLKDNLKKHVLYFSNPLKFNDPFDSKFDVMYKGTKEDWFDFLSRYGMNPIEIDGIINKYKRKKIIKIKENTLILDPHKPTFLKTAKQFRDLLEKNVYRVCCFSKTNLNILLWSHYAESHHGICLCFKADKIEGGHLLKLNSKQHPLCPVKYKKQVPAKVNLLFEKNNVLLIHFILTKYKEWGYEEEYRILLREDEFEGGYYTKKFRKEDLEGIIFGLNVKRENIEAIYDIIDTHYLQKDIKVNFYYTQKIQGKFALKVIKIDSITKYLKKIKN